MKRLLFFIVLLHVAAMQAQPFGLNMRTAGFRIALFIRDTSNTKTDSTQFRAVFGHADNAGHFVQQEELAFRSSFNWATGNFRNAPFYEKPVLIITCTSTPQDTMRLTFEFFLPPGIDDTVCKFYRVYCSFRKGDFPVQEFAFGGESENITLPGDQISVKNELQRDSAGRLHYALEHRWSSGTKAGWEASWYPGGQLRALKHFDRQGSASGYAVTYFENGKIESAGRFSTSYFHYCRTRPSSHGTMHAYIVDHNTRRDGPTRYYNADASLLREEPDCEIVDHGYSDD